MRVLVTGITGFVGRHLWALLRPPEYSVFGTSYPDRPLPSEPDVFFLDMRWERDVFDVVKDVKPEAVFHLAALSNVGFSWERRRETLETNLMGTLYLLEAVKKFTPRARLLFISSSDVYGFGGGGGSSGPRVLSERDGYHIANPYAFSKLASEILSDFYVRIEELDIIITRSFPHTGPSQGPDFVCSDWARQIARIERGGVEPVIRVGNLASERDYSDVRDTVRAYALLMQKGRRGEIYNVCSGRGVSLRKILDRLLSFSKAKIKVEVDRQKLRKTDIPVLVGDNSKLRVDTGWEPQILFEQTLRDLLEDWRNRII